MTIFRIVLPGSDFKQTVQSLLDQADVQINGDRPWDIQVHHQQLYPRLLAEWSMAAGESYMDGWWDCDRLDEMFFRVFRSNLERAMESRTYLHILQAKLLNLQTPYRAFQVGQHHYDIDNLLYQKMLDRRMIYSCGYWRDATTLDQAQEAKLDLICRKLDLQPGMRVLDIGCGWGGTARYIAERYQVEVVGITVSEQQAQFARDICKGLPIEIRLQDYRELKESFDRVISVGMFEHVGYKNYRTYFECVRRCLKDDGRFLLQTIGTNLTWSTSEPWLEKYIFPNSMLPSAKQITTAIEDVMMVEDWHNFGPDYDKTLLAWFHNFDTSWDSLSNGHDERFYRMWKYYLLTCAASFRARKNHLWQILLSPNGLVGDHRFPR